MIRKVLSNNRAGFKELGLLALLLLVCGCSAIRDKDIQIKLNLYNCYWGCLNEAGETGWCCEHEVPQHDRYIFDCKNANERVVK